MKPNRVVMIVLAAVCLAPVAALAVERFGGSRPVNVQEAVPESVTGGATAPRWQLVGFSTQATTGQAGVLGMTTLCQADYPGSRMCTYEEVAGTTNIPPLPSLVSAWTQPVPVDLLSAGRGAESCLNWSDASDMSFGLLISEFGAVSRGRCDGTHNVACCAPM